MDLVKSWLGQALRATGAAVVVPMAVLLALSLTAIGGGGLGGLTQIVSGPEVAGSGLRLDDGDREIGRAVSQLADRRGGAAGGSPGTVARGDGGDAPTGGDGGDTGGGDGEGPGGGAPPGGDGPPGRGSPPDGGGGGGAPPAAPPPPTPPPPEPPGVVEGVGETVTGITEGTPVAPTVEDAVDGLVETCRRMDCP